MFLLLRGIQGNYSWQSLTKINELLRIHSFIQIPSLFIQTV